MLHLLSIVDLFMLVSLLFLKRSIIKFGFILALFTKAMLGLSLKQSGYLGLSSWSSLCLFLAVACLLLGYINRESSIFYRLSILASLIVSIIGGVLIHDSHNSSQSLFVVFSHVVPAFIGVITVIFNLICSVMTLVVNYRLKHNESLESEPSLLGLMYWIRKFDLITVFMFLLAIGSILITKSFSITSVNLVTVGMLVFSTLILFYWNSIKLIKNVYLHIVFSSIFITVIAVSIFYSGNQIHG